MRYISMSRTEIGRLDWNRFVDNHSGGWWWHRSEWLDYSLMYQPGSSDLSFGLVDTTTGKVVGMCPAIENLGEVKMGDDPCAGLLSLDDPVIIDTLIDATASRLTGLQCQWRWNRYPIYNRELIESFNRTTGLSRSSWKTAVVSLGRVHRWNRLRKSYRSLIHQAQRDYVLVSGKSYWKDYEACHRSVATRPRPDATYRVQEQWMNDGFGQVYVAFSKESYLSTPKAVSLVIEYKNHAYYASGASKKRNLQHALQWMAMEDFAKRGGETYELGWINQHGEDDSIGFFKKGFGGDLYLVDAITGVLK